MLTLPEFLLARIAEDEADVQRTRTNALYVSGEVEAEDALDRLASPDRLQAECEVKRRIVDACDGQSLDNSFADPGTYRLADDVLRTLALPYADHPDYDGSWRP